MKFYLKIMLLTLIAAWGQPPVSTAMILSSLSASFLTKNSASSLVKISFVTAHKLYLRWSFRHAASINAVYAQHNWQDLYHGHNNAREFSTMQLNFESSKECSLDCK